MERPLWRFVPPVSLPLMGSQKQRFGVHATQNVSADAPHEPPKTAWVVVFFLRHFDHLLATGNEDEGWTVKIKSLSPLRAASSQQPHEGATSVGGSPEPWTLLGSFATWTVFGAAREAIGLCWSVRGARFDMQVPKYHGMSFQKMDPMHPSEYVLLVF